MAEPVRARGASSIRASGDWTHHSRPAPDGAPQNARRLAAPPAALARFAEREHTVYGYANYWDSMDQPWGSNFKVQVFPVGNCLTAKPVLCPFQPIQISSWYTLRRGVRGMLIVDPTWPLPSRPDPELGTPIASRTFGHLSGYVHSYDIASKLGRD
ncbi:MAG: hypothetical protein ACLP01_04585 [Solirubrobacteraceae bacterium]